MIKVEEVQVMKIDEFMAIEDNDLKKYIYTTGGVASDYHNKMTNNDEKIGFYTIDRSVKINNMGVFYIGSTLREWISYNKLTKRVKLSKACKNVFDLLLKEYFGNNDKLISSMINRATPTLCKKIIEGKITCLRDLMNYHRSYTLRMKHLDVNTIYRFAVEHELYIMHLIEDPENLTNFELLRSMVPPTFIATKPFKIKCSEINTLHERYRKWTEEQDKKYVTLKRQTNGRVRDISSKNLEL